MKLFSFSVFAFLFVGVAHSQTGRNLLPSWEKAVLDSVMNLQYTQPNGYYTNAGYLDWTQGAYFRAAEILMSEPRFVSDDGNFFAMFPVRQPIVCNAAESHSKKKNDCDDVNKEHINLTKKLVLEFYGKEELDNWKDYALYHSSSEAKSKFNADTALYLLLPILDEPYFKDYPYCSVLMIQKNGRGFLPIFCFFNDDGMNDIDTHSAAIERAFRYGNESPVAERIKQEGIVTIIADPKQKKR